MTSIAAPDRLRLLRPSGQVILYFRLVSEIPSQHRVRVSQRERIVTLDNALRGRPILEGVDDAH